MQIKAHLLALIAIATVAWATDGARAGTIAGTVTAKGPFTSATGAGGAYSSMRYKFAEKVDYDHLQDFVVYIDEGVPGATPATAPAATMTQRNVGFDPHVLPISVGTKVRWPNADTIYHNVFSMSETEEFDLGLYAKGEKEPIVLFDKPGQVDVFCSIHSKMHCVILVLPSPYFDKVNSNQRYFLRNVPAGTYKVRAWHERMPPVTKTVTVGAEGETQVDFSLGIGGLPKY